MLISLCSCQYTATDWTAKLCGRKKSFLKKSRNLTFGTWNVRTLIDSGSGPERRTAIIGRELGRYKVDIAALSETHLAGEVQLEEVGAGYTFFSFGRSETERRQSGVGFAIRSPLVKSLQAVTKRFSDRLMLLRLTLPGDRHVSVVSAYAPTMAYPEETKNSFYADLDRLIRTVSRRDKLIILGDFNARVGRSHEAWKGIIGRHGVGKENSNGTLLLEFCARHHLAVTNTFFQLANKYKTTWMHPRSKHWHMLDYAIVHQKDIQDVHVTRALRGAQGWSDHRLVVCKMSIRLNQSRPMCRSKPIKRLDVASLKSRDAQNRLATEMDIAMVAMPEPTGDIEEDWRTLRDVIHNTATNVVGFVKRKHQDWFDENDTEIGLLLDSLHQAHKTWLQEKNSSRKKGIYTKLKADVQKRLRCMKDKWWLEKAVELQEASDRKDMKRFYDGLKAVYGPKSVSLAPIRSMDGQNLLTDSREILQRWAEHFNTLLNRSSTMQEDATDFLRQRDPIISLDRPPCKAEVLSAVKILSNGKSPGPDGIPAEVYKYGGSKLVKRLVHLFKNIWEKEYVPQDFKDANIVHLYKKGDKANCDNHRGISLLSVAGKILAKVLATRLTNEVAESILPESQCGFRSGRGTADMIFSARQLQEKCREQNKDLYMVFIDLTKAFDTVGRDGLWKLLAKLGCTDKFIRLIRSFHDGMMARVVDSAGLSDPFEVSNGTKQGCVLAPILFNIFYAAMLLDAFGDSNLGVDVQYRLDGNVFNLRRLQSKSKILEGLARDLLYADDCCLVAHSLEDVQELTDCFSRAAKRFGLTISISKTEVLLQPRPNTNPPPPVVTIDGAPLKVVDNFCYLGSMLSSDASADEDVQRRVARAGVAFGRLTQRLWNEKDVKLSTKISVYKAVVISTLLYGAETWTVYRHHIRRLDQFHMRCLRLIAKVKWQDMVPNTSVLEICGMMGIEALVTHCQLRWAGHVSRMADDRIPKMMLFGQLGSGERSRGRPKLRFKDVLKQNLIKCGIDSSRWEMLASSRSKWRKICGDGISSFEKSRVDELKKARIRRKEGSVVSADFQCDVCGRRCASRIGLFSHQRTHQR